MAHRSNQRGSRARAVAVNAAHSVTPRLGHPSSGPMGSVLERTALAAQQPRGEL